MRVRSALVLGAGLVLAGGLATVVPTASAQATRLGSHTTTLASEYAKQGRDWETELRQRAKELALMAELGLPTAATGPSQDSQPARVTEDDDAERD